MLREATPYIKHILAGRIAECDDVHLRAQYAELGGLDVQLKERGRGM
jgi:hypothetical protein